MKKALQKGFTLIELLVVIAIIGILASVILASLNSARAKGTDAAVKSDLENARPQAEIYYDGKSPNSYASVCTTLTSATPGGINTMMTDAASKIGGSLVTALATGGTSSTIVCHDSATGWAAVAPLKAVTNAYWCVDSTGKAEQTAVTSPLANTTVCP